uniref:Cytochrome P450 n=1 Tax=Macrostomum lignano TaxID=282301 RepID=A0A1I8F872_9PLAT
LHKPNCNATAHRQLFADWAALDAGGHRLGFEFDVQQFDNVLGSYGDGSRGSRRAAYAAYCQLEASSRPAARACRGAAAGATALADALCLHLTMQKECQKYGDLCSFYLGGRLFVVVNSYPLMKEMLDDPGVFAGRPRLRLFEKMTRNCGIFLVEGKVWCHQRRLRPLREIGFSGSKAVGMIEDQLGAAATAAGRGSGGCAAVVKTLDTFLLAVNSVITEMTLGRRFHARRSRLQEGDQPDRGHAGVGHLRDRLLSVPGRREAAWTSYRCLRGSITAEAADAGWVRCAAHLPAAMRTIQRKRPRAEKAGDFADVQGSSSSSQCASSSTWPALTRTARSMEWLLLYMAFLSEVQDRVTETSSGLLVVQSRRSRIARTGQNCHIHQRCHRRDLQKSFAGLPSEFSIDLRWNDATFTVLPDPSDAIYHCVYGVTTEPSTGRNRTSSTLSTFLDGRRSYRSSPYSSVLIWRRSCVGESLGANGDCPCLHGHHCSGTGCGRARRVRQRRTTSSGNTWDHCECPEIIG